VEAHLSTDKTRIYTESHVYVEDFLKLPSDQKPARENERVIDQIGGVLKLPSGQVIRDASRIDFLGGTRVGGRYVLFAKMIHHRKDLTLIRGYELRERRVFKLTDDGSPGNTLVSDIPGAEAIPSEEEEFIQTARNKLQNK
jgi:hypothetical protein